MTTPAIVFLAGLAVFLGLYIAIGVRFLPMERGQFIAAVPCVKEKDGTWSGLNLTCYGVLSANAYVLATAVFVFLLASVGATVLLSVLGAVFVLAVCMPLSRVIARIVEKKRHTFTVGGASFAGLVIAPPIFWGLNAFAHALGPGAVHVAPAIAAMAVAYAFGEGLGRLACLSFGCCYGRRLDEAPLFVRRILMGVGTVFSGKTKKAAYESGLDGVKLVPIQALTAVLYSVTGLVASGLFLLGWYRWAFLCAVLVTQGWRAWSETLRADFRGSRKITAYQVMAVAAMGYAVFLSIFLPDGGGKADVLSGARAVVNLPSFLFFQGLWLASFLYTGRSTVTGSKITFHIFPERI